MSLKGILFISSIMNSCNCKIQIFYLFFITNLLKAWERYFHIHLLDWSAQDAATNLQCFRRLLFYRPSSRFSAARQFSTVSRVGDCRLWNRLIRPGVSRTVGGKDGDCVLQKLKLESLVCWVHQVLPCLGTAENIKTI